MPTTSSTKRALFVTPPSRSPKRAKTTAALTKDVAQLKRQVNSNKPEVRQITYTVQIGTGTTPGPLLDPTNVAGDEIRLHRLMVAWQTSTGQQTLTDEVYWQLHSPQQGYDPADGFAETNTNSVNSYLGYPDQTKQRIWVRGHDNLNSIGNPDSDPANNFYQLGNIYVLDKKFSIPMKVGMEAPNEAAPTVQHNQVYFSGSTAATGGLARVTIWYTDA